MTNAATSLKKRYQHNLDHTATLREILQNTFKTFRKAVTYYSEDPDYLKGAPLQLGTMLQG